MPGARARGTPWRTLLLWFGALLAVVRADYYKTLGLTRRATADEVKKAYRREALKCHPDRVTTDKLGAAERFKTVQEAHEVLSDARKRRTYDMQQRLPAHMREGAQRSGGGFPFPPGAFGAGGYGFPPGDDDPPPPPTRRTVACTLQELQDGATRRVVLQDSPL